MQNADQIVETVQQLTRGIAEIRDETYRLLSRTVNRIISGEIAEEADVRKILNLILNCGADERIMKLTGKLCKYIDLGYSKSSVQPTLLRGLKKTSRFFDATINKVPLISDMPVATAFADAENKLDKFEANSSEQRLHELVGYQSAYVRPFIDNIEIICQLYDNPISLYFDKDAIYLGVADAKQTASVNC